jgi:hypothetical protein
MMVRITTCVTAILILTIGAASAQTDTQGPNVQSLSGYSPMRTQQERRDDRDIDSAYKSAIKATTKARPDAEKKNSDPWSDVRSTSPAAAKNKQ